MCASRERNTMLFYAAMHGLDSVIERTHMTRHVHKTETSSRQPQPQPQSQPETRIPTAITTGGHRFGRCWLPARHRTRRYHRGRVSSPVAGRAWGYGLGLRLKPGPGANRARSVLVAAVHFSDLLQSRRETCVTTQHHIPSYQTLFYTHRVS